MRAAALCHTDWDLLQIDGRRVVGTLTRLVTRGQVQPMVLAMPSDGLAGYTTAYLDSPSRRVSDWITVDVPAIASELVPDLGDIRFIGGLSIGGWGAVRMAMTAGTGFLAMAAHSTVTRLLGLADFEAGFAGFDASTLGTDEKDLGCFLINADREVPPFYLDCGIDDPLIDANRALHYQLDDAGIPHEYAEHPGGHTWQYWRDRLPDTLRFFNAQATEATS